MPNDRQACSRWQRSCRTGQTQHIPQPCTRFPSILRNEARGLVPPRSASCAPREQLQSTQMRCHQTVHTLPERPSSVWGNQIRPRRRPPGFGTSSPPLPLPRAPLESETDVQPPASFRPMVPRDRRAFALCRPLGLFSTAFWRFRRLFPTVIETHVPTNLEFRLAHRGMP